MKKILIILFLTFISKNSFAADGTGPATEYIVTMKKIELCEDSACSSSTTVGDSSMAVDISGVSAGADVGKFASTDGLPIGTTFSHLRVTIDRSFTITGSVTIGSTTCGTDGGTDNDADHLLDSGTGTPVSTAMYLSDADGYAVADGDNDADQISIGYDSPTHASSMSVSGDDALMIYKLSTPYKVGFKTPLIKVKFNTQNAVGADDTSCVMYVEEPTVTISIQ